jgi:MFS family permease
MQGLRGPKKRRKQAPEGLLGASVAALFFSNLVLSTLPPFFPRYALFELDLDVVSIALVFTALPIATGLGSWAGSALRHTIDDCTQLFMGNAMLAAGTFLFGISSQPSSLVACRSAQGLGAALASSSLTRVLLADFPHNLGPVLTLHETFTGLGYLLGPLVGGVLYQSLLFRNTFIVLGCLTVLAPAPLLFILSSHWMRRRRRRIARAHRNAAAAAKGMTPNQHSMFTPGPTPTTSIDSSTHGEDEALATLAGTLAGPVMRNVQWQQQQQQQQHDARYQHGNGVGATALLPSAISNTAAAATPPAPSTSSTEAHAAQPCTPSCVADASTPGDWQQQQQQQQRQQRLYQASADHHITAQQQSRMYEQQRQRSLAGGGVGHSGGGGFGAVGGRGVTHRQPRGCGRCCREELPLLSNVLSVSTVTITAGVALVSSRSVLLI